MTGKERKGLLGLVKDFLLACGYRMTAVTLAEESDVSDWPAGSIMLLSMLALLQDMDERMGIDFNKVNLLSMYRDRLLPVSSAVNFNT